jgi:hypothetical protein
MAEKRELTARLFTTLRVTALGIILNQVKDLISIELYILSTL